MQSQACLLCLQWARNVDYLLMAKLVAISYTWESTATWWASNCFAGLQVVLSEDHNFCRNRQEWIRSEWCEIGEQGGFNLRFKKHLVAWVRTVPWPWLEFFESEMNSRRRKVCGLFGPSRVFWCSLLHKQDGKVVTWLILPVVICLSQRLSHACLSINKFVLWNCEWLIKSVIVYLMLHCYMDNCGNSRANTCNQAPTSGRGVFIR